MQSLTARAINAKKKTLRSTQAATERVQKLRCEYWEQVKDIEPHNLVFLDETGVLLGLTRTYARSPRGSRVYDLKPFYRGARVTVDPGIIRCLKKYYNNRNERVGEKK